MQLFWNCPCDHSTQVSAVSHFLMLEAYTRGMASMWALAWMVLAGIQADSTCMQMISLRPVGICLNDMRANAGLQTAQAGRALSQHSHILPAQDGFNDPQVHPWLRDMCMSGPGMLQTDHVPQMLTEDTQRRSVGKSAPLSAGESMMVVKIRALQMRTCLCAMPYAHVVAQELLEGYSETGVAYLDLSYYPTDALTQPGPAACIAGELKLVPGQFGMPSQVGCHHSTQLLQQAPHTPGHTDC